MEPEEGSDFYHADSIDSVESMQDMNDNLYPTSLEEDGSTSSSQPFPSFSDYPYEDSSLASSNECIVDDWIIDPLSVSNPPADTKHNGLFMVHPSETFPLPTDFSKRNIETIPNATPAKFTTPNKNDRNKFISPSKTSSPGAIVHKIHSNGAGTKTKTENPTKNFTVKVMKTVASLQERPRKILAEISDNVLFTNEDNSSSSSYGSSLPSSPLIPELTSPSKKSRGRGIRGSYKCAKCGLPKKGHECSIKSPKSRSTKTDRGSPTNESEGLEEFEPSPKIVKRIL